MQMLFEFIRQFREHKQAKDQATSNGHYLNALNNLAQMTIVLQMTKR